MKFFYLVMFVSISLANSSAAEWEVISETQDCPKKIQIKAKQGEKFVIAVEGNHEHRLESVGGAGFDPKSMNAVEYASSKKDGMGYSFIQPSYVENRPAKLQFSKDGKADRCPLLAK